MRFVLILITALFCSSCTILNNGMDGCEEVAKTLWGSTTRALEKARDNAVVKTYDKSYWDCIRAAKKAVDKNEWVMFNKNEIKGYMVVMGIKGAVNTTEVGIFFDEVSDTQTRIEISSLSTNAKRKVAKGLFHKMDIVFGYLPPDPPLPKDLDKKKTEQLQEHV